MGNPKLYVAFFQPIYGNYQHWALYLQTDTEHLVFEVTGSHPEFQRNVSDADPRSIDTLIRLIFLDTINPADIATVQNVASTTYIDNETVEWDCQEYVFDMLETLEEECVVDTDEEIYQQAKEELKEKRGATM